MHKTCLVLLAICLQANDIRISEVMSNPQGSEYENEFIELFNASDHVMQINGWILSDGNGDDTIAYLSGPMELQPSQYALIIDPGYDFAGGPYGELINDSLSIYTISTDASFGSGGLSNSGESVIIRNPDSSIFREMSWSSSTSNGFSWERVSVNSIDSQSTWEQSLIINGTPGYRNSVTSPLINLSIVEVEIETVEIGEEIRIRLHIKNQGELSVQDFSISMFLDEDQDGIAEGGEWSEEFHFDTELITQETMALPLALFPLIPGVHQLEVQVIVENDEVLDDDSLNFIVIGAYPRDVISITEVMYSPSTDQQGEWVEIQNRSAGPVSLQGWTFSDANQTKHSVTDTLLFLDSFQHLTLCMSASMANYFGLEAGEVLELDSWPALNSSSDSVRLFDASGHAIASVFYRGIWGKSATSLERRHPDGHPFERINWAASTQLDGGTPSRMNTRHLLPVEIQIDEIVVANIGRVGPTQVVVHIRFQNLGMDTLYHLELESDADIHWYGVLPSFGSDSLVFTSPILWPGYSQIPIRIIHDDDILADTSVQVVLGFPSDLIALNEIHYIPHEDQTEFLEFVNISTTSLDLKGWRFRDRSGAQGAIMTQILIQPDSLFLWTGDAITLADWAPSCAQVCELSYWPSLNNSSDSIIIMDPLGHRMLAHGYDAPRDDEAGKSLERMALWKSQEIESSWSVCLDPLGITPGRVNSVQVPPQNLAISEIVLLDSMLWEGEVFFIRSLVINTGEGLVEDAELSIKFLSNSSEIENWLELLPPLWAGDTLVWDFEIPAGSSGWFTVEVEVRCSGDGSSADNRHERRVYISGGTSSLIINEVMPLPLYDQNEWIEIYNRSGGVVDLQSWLIADNSGSRVCISDSSLLMDPKSYLVIGVEQAFVADMLAEGYLSIPHFPTLNNSEEQISLFDPQEVLMDGMGYDQSTELVLGRSLERIRPETPGEEPGNWSVCIGDKGSTPGEENSLYLDVLASKLDIELYPNPFSPNGDGYADQVGIRYELPFEKGLMSVDVFDVAGRKIAQPVQVKPVSHRGEVVWDGESNYGGKAVTGLYIMKLLFDDQAGKVWSCLKKVYLIR